jgi:flagellar basal-body rod protein FlgB
MPTSIGRTSTGGKELARRDKGVPAIALRVLIPNWLYDGHEGALGYSAMLDQVGAQLERYLDLLSARQKLVASNIANADTPGYQTQDIDFQSEFQNALGGSPHVLEVSDLPVKNDGNNVSLDRESRLLSENALRFSVATSLLRSQIQTIRSAIKEGQGS